MKYGTQDPKQEMEAQVDNSLYEKCANHIKQLFGEELTPEKISHYVQSADGNLHVAINQILNDLEKQKTTSKPSPEPSGPPLEKIISELAEELKCPICLGFFDNPVVLGCLHTFCLCCTEEIAKDSDVVVCPLCRQNTELNGRGPSSLKSNIYIANIVEKLKSAQVSQCDHCPNNSIFYCSTCNIFLCHDCDTKHHVQPKLAHQRVLADEMFTKKIEPKTNPKPTNFQLEGGEWVVPFNITKEVCGELFQSWAKNLWFAPTDLGPTARLREFTPYFFPFWFFEMEVSSRFHWLPTQKPSSSVKASTHKVQLLMSASNQQHSTLLKEIEPWKIEQLKQMSSKETENMVVVPFSVNQEVAEKSEGFKDSLDQICKEKHVQKNNLDPTVWANSLSMSVSHTILRKSCRKLFVPVFVTTYEYRGKKYDFLVNASTTKCYGQRPYSAGKLLSLGFTGVGALGLIAGARTLNNP